LREKGWMLAVLVLFFCSIAARCQFEFGAEEHPTAGGEVLIVEDFSSVLGFAQELQA